jgi:hypothetical protein
MERVVSAFEAFSGRFETGTDKDRENVQLKREHSRRVLDDARLIVRGRDPAPGLRLAVEAAALLHDAGRFLQYARYKSFHDPSTENHARLGVQAVLREGLAAGLPTPVRRLVIGAVFLHNVRDLPSGLKPELDFTVRVVRDADKLDILRVMQGYFDSEGGYNPVVLLGLQPDPERYTPEILESVLAGRPADYGSMAWVNDFKLLLLSWAFAFNFATARRAVLERGLLQDIQKTLPQGSAFQRAVSRAQQALQQDKDREAPA